MDDRTPPGEHDVFNMLAAGPEDWVALRSLDLAPWNRGLRTELDFVVIAPEAGILCVEVKSHENISFDGQRWYPDTITRSPFKQAADGRHTFYRRLLELAPQFRRVPVVHCCIFPRSPFDLPPNLSIQPWELMDSRAFRSFTSGGRFCADLKVRMEQSIEADANLATLSLPLSRDQIDTLLLCCLPVQKRRPGGREEIARRQEQMDRLLREQQKPVLQLAALNERVVVSGGAGTGKTLIAMEVARRAAERGRRVALLCFNQLVGEWMRQQMEQASLPQPNLLVGRAIRVMAELTGLEIPENPSREFWEADLPKQLEERLTDPDFKSAATFDYLVVDEAQDLLARPRIWECLSQFAACGLEKGAFALFGDFDNQVLAERGTMAQTLLALDACARPSRWRLSENCRNYRIVGDTAVSLSGLGKLVYSGYMRAGGGVQNYDISFYEHERAQLDKLGQWLKEFRSQGYKPSEITLLSFRSEEASAAARLRQEGYKLRPAWSAAGLTGCASVHAFKGMENKVIILTDVVLVDREFDRHLFYTGMTRATESVRVLCAKSCQETLLGWFTERNEI
jgi:Nuclease-related domain/UvrD-like helicase C-terminal domain/AAA domain